MNCGTCIACRQGKTVFYFRMPRLLADLAAARGDGSYDRLFRKIARADVLLLDDWGPEQLTAPQRRDLMEIIDERYSRKATIVTSQLPVDTWHDMIGEKPRHMTVVPGGASDARSR